MSETIVDGIIWVVRVSEPVGTIDVAPVVGNAGVGTEVVDDGKGELELGFVVATMALELEESDVEPDGDELGEFDNKDEAKVEPPEPASELDGEVTGAEGEVVGDVLPVGEHVLSGPKVEPAEQPAD